MDKYKTINTARNTTNKQKRERERERERTTDSQKRKPNLSPISQKVHFQRNS